MLEEQGPVMVAWTMVVVVVDMKKILMVAVVVADTETAAVGAVAGLDG